MNKTEKAIIPGVSAALGGFIGASMGNAMGLHWAFTK